MEKTLENMEGAYGRNGLFHSDNGNEILICMVVVIKNNISWEIVVEIKGEYM